MGAGERPPEAGLETAVSGAQLGARLSSSAVGRRTVTEWGLLLCREEQDFEYARLIQEEILRGAEEAQRREQDDEVSARSPSRVCRVFTQLVCYGRCRK